MAYNINKYSPGNFEIEPIFTVFDDKWADFFEIYFIKTFNSTHPSGMNLTIGGVGIKQNNNNYRKKISNSVKRLWENCEYEKKYHTLIVNL